MVSTGQPAPTFTATYRGSDHETFAFADALGDESVVLAFFPGAFTPPCTSEMDALQEHIGAIENAGATLYGVSADSAFAQEAFADARGLEFDLISDMAGRAIEQYDVSVDIPDLGLYGVANRAVFVVDAEGTISYSWRADDPTTEPDYDALLEAVEAA